MFMACSSRCWRSQACGESPVLSLKARQKWKRDSAGIRSQRRERDVRIAVGAQAFDGAAQYHRREAAHDRLERDRRAGVRSQQARGQKIRQLLPEQGIQRRAAFKRIRRTQEQSGCNEVGMPRSFQEIARGGHVGFAGNTLERSVRKVELNDMHGLGISHRELEPAGMIVTTPGRAVPIAADFPVRRSSRCEPAG